MGNCLPFLHRRVSGGGDDFTRLENLSNEDAESAGGRRRHSSSHHHGHSRHSSAGGSSVSSSTSGGGGGGSSDGGGRRRHRNLQASSYVNQLYMSSAFGPGGDESSAAELKLVDEKRKARIRGLLEQIPIDMYVEGGGEEDSSECAICMGDFQPGDPIRFLPCMHAYHLQCIDDWLLRSFTCPSCMEPVDSALLSAFTVNTAASRDLAWLTAASTAMASSSSASGGSSSAAGLTAKTAPKDVKIGSKMAVMMKKEEDEKEGKMMSLEEAMGRKEEEKMMMKVDEEKMMMKSEVEDEGLKKKLEEEEEEEKQWEEEKRPPLEDEQDGKQLLEDGNGKQPLEDEDEKKKEEKKNAA